MAAGVTKEVTQFTGKVGRCEKDHVVEILTNGYGFCVECADEIDGYSTLYVASIKDGPQPVELEE